MFDLNPDKKKEKYHSLLEELKRKMDIADSDDEEKSEDPREKVMEAFSGEPGDDEKGAGSHGLDSSDGIGESSLSDDEIASLLKRKNTVPKPKGTVTASFMMSSKSSDKKSKGRPKGSKAKY